MLTLAYAARLLEKMYFTPSPPADATHPGTAATDGGTTDAAAPIRDAGSADPISVGMVAVVVVAAVVAVALGFAGGTFADLLEPFVTEVFN
jgi:multicomponent Na+:H+ antiporter subunit D